MRKKFLFITLFISTFFNLSSQSWTIVDDKSIPIMGARNINPDKFITTYVDDISLKEILWQAPDEKGFDPSIHKHTTINVMLSDGTIDQFSIVRYQMMEAELANRFEDFRTFYGNSTTNPLRRIRISYTVHGLRALITDQDGQTYIDHLQRKDKDHKIIYRRNDYRTNEDWECLFEGEKSKIKEDLQLNTRSGDCTFRSYRLAMTATGEYSNYHDAFSAADAGLVLSAIMTTVDRVNDVFEQDITVRLILIGNTDAIFYYDIATDPFAGTNASSMINQNQTNTDAVIMNANYDLGHIVSTGGSGLAGLGVICSTGNKARGVTGIAIPEGDPFDIDYVAHEMGHQLGANHTQNNSCNRNNATAMEPGSASTIMGYAGICSPNVQNNSDAYFHAISIQEMNAEILGDSCHQTISFGNSAPIANPLTNKSIPKSTPFVLDVVATDADENDVLTYNWEQMDNEVGSMPPSSTNTVGPMFRSIFATTDSKRYFPNLTTLTSNGTFQWEVLPSVDRNMDFRVTVRDNTFGPGCTDEQDITIDVDGNSGPFLVTSQNTSTTWLEGQSVTITWDVANTTAAPVNCTNVDIFLSYDSGFTYPTTLVANTPNDGSQSVVIPQGLSTTCRFMVKCADNVFFDINNTDITVESGAPSFTIESNPISGIACDDDVIIYTIQSTSILGFTDPITLSVADLPAGASASFATNPIVPGNSTSITINNNTNQTGNFDIKVTGISGSIQRETFYDLTIISQSQAPSLISPLNASTGQPTALTLEWSTTSNTTSYEYQLSTSPNGANVIFSGSTASTSILVSPELAIATTYFWSVRSITECGLTDWSDEWSFETGACVLRSANDLPITISASGTPTITSSFSVKDKGIITDLNVAKIKGTHTWISDLNFTLIAPDNTSNAFFSDPCTSQNNFDIGFDDEAPSAAYPCPPTDGMKYQPDNPLSIFDGKQFYGPWTLSVFDDFNQDGGSLDEWQIEYCLDMYCDLTVNNSTYTDAYGSLKKALACASDGDTIFLESSIANSTIDMGANSVLIDASIVIVANPSDNIRVLSESTLPSITINAGKSVTFIGFSIENIDNSTGVVANNGTTTLRDMTITAGVGNISVINSTGATINLEGMCEVKED